MIQPLHSRVLVEAIPRKDEISAGGVIKVAEADDRPSSGNVIAVGPDVTAVKVGDLVAYGRFAGIRMDTDGEAETMLLLEEELLAKLPQPPVWTITVEVDGGPGISLGVIEGVQVKDERLAAVKAFVLSGILVDDVPPETRKAAMGGDTVAVYAMEIDKETDTCVRVVTIHSADPAVLLSGKRLIARAQPTPAGLADDRLT